MNLEVLGLYRILIISGLGQEVGRDAGTVVPDVIGRVRRDSTGEFGKNCTRNGRHAEFKKFSRTEGKDQQFATSLQFLVQLDGCERSRRRLLLLAKQLAKRGWLWRSLLKLRLEVEVIHVVFESRQELDAIEFAMRRVADAKF